ncbi:hypothetical protein [Burkholderia orbicola]|uniref:hypothetical protein n=1 Tax=Burkholderia orbicola TaxID=2978683 RepID=UPI002FE1E0AD
MGLKNRRLMRRILDKFTKLIVDANAAARRIRSTTVPSRPERGERHAQWCGAIVRSVLV